MDVLPTELLLVIADSLPIIDRISFLSLNCYLNNLKSIILFNDAVSYNKILNLDYLNQFTNVIFDTEMVIKIPKNLKKIQFTNYIRDCYTLRLIINRLKTLNGYGDTFGIIESLPLTLTSINFPNHFNRTINLTSFQLLTEITFGNTFNEPIKGLLPPFLTSLTFGHNFNQLIQGALPESLVSLTFGCDFNQLIQEMLPNLLVNLTFGIRFNKPIEGILPNSLINLSFGDFFDQPIRGNLPNSLVKLNFGYGFAQEIRDAIPLNVKFLTLPYYYSWNSCVFPKDCEVELLDSEMEEVD